MRAGEQVKRGGSFPGGVHEDFRRIRKRHFWFENRRRALGDVLRSLPVSEELPVVEVGCGDGYLLALLPGILRVGVDLNPNDLALARQGWPGPLVSATAERLPFRKPLSLICAFDVMEHLADESAFLRECHRNLDGSGKLVVTVPAGPGLWSSFDEFAGHYRRYTRQALAEVLQGAGFRIQRLFPLFRVLRPLAWISARAVRRKPVVNPAVEYSVHPLANAILSAALRFEWLLFRQRPVGAGTSWCAVSQKHGPDQGHAGIASKNCNLNA